VVLDGFVSDTHRAALRELITEAAWAADAQAPPESKWERKLTDLDGLPPSWGLSEPALEAVVRPALSTFPLLSCSLRLRGGCPSPPSRRWCVLHSPPSPCSPVRFLCLTATCRSGLANIRWHESKSAGLLSVSIQCAL
jgi:hypothetical protein